jgi:hypothetical protein
MYVPTIGWQGEQKIGASVGTPSIVAGWSTRAAIQDGPDPSEPAADPESVAVVALAAGERPGPALDTLAGEHAAATEATAMAINARETHACRMRRCLLPARI